MNPEPGFVFDTSAIVSALLFEQSVPGRAFYAALEHGQILVSQEALEELRDVLSRRKFDRYLDQEDRDDFLAKLVREATLVEVSEEIHDCRDARDNKFLELAVAGHARCLVSGDNDLLVLSPFRGIPILTPARFLEFLAEHEKDEV